MRRGCDRRIRSGSGSNRSGAAGVAPSSLAALLVLLGAAPDVEGQGLPRSELHFPEGRTAVELPLEREGRFIVVPVAFDGVGTLRFVLDTGAPVMVVPDTALAARMDLQVVGQARVGGTGDGEPLTAPLAVGASARVGPLQIRNEVVILGVAGDAIGALDGVIGLSVFQNAVVEIDWDRSRLVVHDTAAFAYDGDGAVLPLHMAPSRHPYTEAKLSVVGDDEVPVKLVVDSGARQGLTLFPSSAAELGRPALTTQDTVIGRGSRGEARGDMGTVRRLALGSQVLEDVRTAFPYGGGEPDLHGVVGLPVLERFHVWIDIPGGRLILEPRSAGASDGAAAAAGAGDGAAEGEAAFDRKRSNGWPNTR